MSLTKEDLRQIGALVDQKFDEFAVIVKTGFDAVDKRFDTIEAILRNHTARLSLIETDLAGLRNLYKEVLEIRKLLSQPLICRP